MDLKRIGWKGVDWKLLAQDSQWRDFVNTLMNLGFCDVQGIYLLAERL
jgi:hypothetical protein